MVTMLLGEGCVFRSDMEISGWFQASPDVLQLSSSGFGQVFVRLYHVFVTVGTRTGLVSMMAAFSHFMVERFFSSSNT